MLTRQIGLLALGLIPLMATAAIVQMQMMNGSYGDDTGLDGGARAGVILGGALNGVTTVAAFNMQDSTSSDYEQVRYVLGGGAIQGRFFFFFRGGCCGCLPNRGTVGDCLRDTYVCTSDRKQAVRYGAVGVAKVAFEGDVTCFPERASERVRQLSFLSCIPTNTHKHALPSHHARKTRSRRHKQAHTNTNKHEYTRRHDHARSRARTYLPQAVAKSIEGRKKRGLMTAAAFGYSQGMMFFVFAVIFYVGAILVDDGTISFLMFFQAFFAVFLGAFGVGQVRVLQPSIFVFSC